MGYDYLLGCDVVYSNSEQLETVKILFMPPSIALVNMGLSSLYRGRRSEILFMISLLLFYTD
jgi:hypothetical protein